MPKTFDGGEPLRDQLPILVHGPSGFSLPLGGKKATIYQIKAYHV